MSGLDQLPTKDWGKAASSVIKPVSVFRAGPSKRSISAERACYAKRCWDLTARRRGRDDLSCVTGSDRPGSTYWVLEARAVPDVSTPQHMTNHWGIWVPSRGHVDAAYELLNANKEKYGLLRVQPPRQTHEGARDYSFYFEDVSHVWWEIGEHPNEDEFMELFGHGDWDRREEART